MIFVYCAVAIVLSIALVWFFFAPRKGEHTVINGAKQEITISINGSYSPALIYAQAGTPLTIYFDRKDSGECTSHVVFPILMPPSEKQTTPPKLPIPIQTTALPNSTP